MARGPLPKPDSRRRNAPTITSTVLPAAGRTGELPKVPPPVKLGKSGRVWWRWAWSTPQSAAWDAGSLQIVARRAALEDDLEALADVRSLDVLDAFEELAPQIKAMVRTLASLATGRLAVLKEMREMDRALGLTPKALADLRWTIKEDELANQPATAGATVTRLRAVDPAAVNA